MASAKNSHFIDLTKINLFETIYDVKYKEVIAWKEQNPGRKAIALFPVYVPSELIHSYNHLPVNIYGGGEEVSISHADAILGSFICSISKSTTELLLSQEEFQKAFDGFVFPFICDVARNLSGIFGRRSTKPAYMLHLAQNFQSPSGITFLAKEYQRLVSTLFPDENLNLENLRESIKLFNHNRQLHRDLYQLRWEKPWNVPLKEMYEIMRVGSTLTVETHNRLLKQKMDQIKLRDGRTKDAIRVVVTGNFCEQPPLDFIDLIEQV
ncbi:MAG: 2-hydroxyacyl-CoA dehydratase, partial [Candidatus Heimdallarchaeota archaeon]|nr:2-hydroxyacyl-CoA dehydratase [Candidatus Heimdallarchaeota archaeon]